MTSFVTRATRWRPSRRLLVILAVVVALVAAAAVGLVLSRPADVATRTQFVQATPEDGRPVELDTTLYLPASTPAPAVLLAHGFGGSKESVASDAEDLARHGYVVLAYSARGFGASGGDIHLDAPDYEVKDASTLLDFLASRPEVQQDGPRDPHVGVAGGSYGGALALLLAGTDKRVDAVAADITWNDLNQALVPNGVFKKQWAGYLFQGGFAAAGVRPDGDGSAGGSQVGQAVSCGRFAPDVCAAYQELASTGTASAATTALLKASSPETVAQDITAPTLLTQGEDDSLFPLDQADANAKAISAAGTDVRVVWRQGGHDAAGTGNDVVRSSVEDWFDEHLRGEGTSSRSFQLARGGPRVSATTGTTDWVGRTFRVDGGYPGIDGHPASKRLDLAVSDTTAQPVAAPAGGVPAAVSSLPGVGGLLSVAGGAGALSAIPGQTAGFTTAPLSDATLIAGTPTVSLTVTPTRSTDATLFVALRDVDPAGGSGGVFGGGETLPSNLVTPVHLTGLTPGQASTVEVSLPTIAYQVAAGHRIALTVSTTDQAYDLPADARTYLVGVSGRISVPTVTATGIGSTVSWTPWIVTLAVVLVVAALATLAWVRRRRAHVAGLDEGLAEVPVAVQDLVKSYKDGYRAVDGVSFVVERGQVVGLLGPNGAGKTTTLRVLMGLMRPTSGSVRVFGEPVLPGAAVLSRLGSFVEGSGFMPHLSGLANLRLYWAATGRPDADARFDVAVQIAGLGTSIERRVKTYSQGMRQRLAIAQSMLGLPEVLVLDEPTNGLDPPQIAEMREVLRRYADTGRTVLLSSHLLAEVEQTCTHVVVMHRGRVVAAGTVADVAGRGGVQLVVDDPARASEVLSAAGITATTVPARRALEDVFLELVDDGGEAR